MFFYKKHFRRVPVRVLRGAFIVLTLNFSYCFIITTLICVLVIAVVNADIRHIVADKEILFRSFRFFMG